MQIHRPRRAVSTLLAIMVFALLLAGCSRSQDAPPSNEPASPSTSESGTAPATSAAEGAAPVPLDQIELGLEPVASGFDRPLLVTNAGDGSGRLFVLEQAGRIRIVRDGVVKRRAYLDIRDRVSNGGERGLLGLAFAPDYEDSGRFYVNYTDLDGNTVVARYVAGDPASDAPRFSRPDAIFRQDQPYPNHNGGGLAFAPDGTLWVGMGDGGSGGDPENRAQNPRVLLGKMLSLDVEGTDGTPKPKVVMSGLRNPWRFSFDPENDDVWIGDVGQNAWEEVDLIAWKDVQGANLGWNHWEGSHAFAGGEPASKRGFVFPVIEYSHDEGESVTGGYVYRGADFPALRGVYVYADFVSRWVAIARESESGRVETYLALPQPDVRPSSFGLDEQGELFICDYSGGSVLQVTAK